MKKNIKIATQFAGRIKKTKGIIQIILFGSVATGEDTESSDIDIAVVYRGDKFSIMGEVNRNKPEKIQTTFISIDGLYKETELIGALAGDGILLYGKPMVIKEKGMDLTESVLVSYSLAKLKQSEKVKLNRAIYGSSSKSHKNGKVYITRVKGLASEPGIEKVNDGVLLIQRRKARKVINVLRRFGVEFKQNAVWTY